MEKTLALFHEHGTRKIYITMYSEVFHWAIKTQQEYNFVIFQSCQLKIIFQSIMWLLLIGQIDQADKWQSGQKWTERPATTICHYHKNICVNKNIHGWWKTMQHLYGSKKRPGKLLQLLPGGKFGWNRPQSQSLIHLLHST